MFCDVRGSLNDLQQLPRMFDVHMGLKQPSHELRLFCLKTTKDRSGEARGGRVRRPAGHRLEDRARGRRERIRLEPVSGRSDYDHAGTTCCAAALVYRFKTPGINLSSRKHLGSFSLFGHPVRATRDRKLS